jgi:hypothetical protein
LSIAVRDKIEMPFQLGRNGMGDKDAFAERERLVRDERQVPARITEEPERGRRG